MKVLHFYKTAQPDSMGGIEQVIHQIASGASKHGVKTEVLSLTREKEPIICEMNDYRVHRAHLDFELASTSFSASAFKYFAKLAKQSDVIHYHFPWPFMDIVHFASRINKPTVVTYHSDIIKQKYLLKLYHPLQNKFLSSVDHIVATSPNYLATSEVLRRFPDKVSTIAIGLDKSTYPTPDAARLRKWQAIVGTRFFLFVGVLRYYKGLHILIEAAKGLDYPIVIVGAGPIERDLKKHVHKLGLKNFYFLGAVSEEDKVTLLTLSYAVLFPSHLRSEAFGISLLEGAMFAKPMISSEIGTGTTYINQANETGLVVPPSDPLALKQAMQYLWENPALAEVMGVRAELRYKNQFTAEKMVASYVKLYTHLVSSHKS